MNAFSNCFNEQRHALRLASTPFFRWTTATPSTMTTRPDDQHQRVDSGNVSPTEVNFVSDYIPPLRYHFLTRLYDPVVRVTTRERMFKHALLEQAQIKPGQEVLDLGCGTGTLTLQIARACPRVIITGIDGDPDALAIARAKAAQDATAVTFTRAFAQHLPFDGLRFDTVVSSLFFHHLTRIDKKSALPEAGRVLKPGGELHVADWGEPANFLMHAVFLTVRLLDGFETTRESVSDGLLELMRTAGFAGVAKTVVINTPIGSIGIYRATKTT